MDANGRTYWTILGLVLCAMTCGAVIGWALRGWAP